MGKPVVKWAGGKRGLLDDILACFPQTFAAYHEPFVGGGAVLFDLGPSEGSINDLNSHLITLYRVIRDEPEQLIEKNRQHIYEEEYYYDARDQFNGLVRAELDSLSDDQRLKKASLFIYLNRTGYNGLYRENSDGEFNVPFGRHSNPNLVREDQIRTASEILTDVTINHGDFSYITETAATKDVVYFDPPYDTGSNSSDFTQYQAEGFGREDQRRLRDVARTLDQQGCSVIVSNAPSVAELYEEDENFDIIGVSATRSINSDSTNRDEVREVLITNVAPDERRQRSLQSYLE